MHLYTFDISSHIHRLYHQLVKQGKNVGDNFLVQPTINLINKEIRIANGECTHILFAFDDNSDETFRKQLSPEYKMNREKQPEELTIQKRLLFKTLRERGYTVLCLPEYEADDIIGTLARKTTEHNIKHTIFTKDKDLFCLVNDYTDLFLGAKVGHINYEGVIKNKGVKPSQICDYLALVGDTSDNIKGVEGVGEKTAVKILQYYTLSDIVANPSLLLNVPKIRGVKSIINYIANNEEQIQLSRELVSLKNNLTLNINLSDLKI